VAADAPAAFFSYCRDDSDFALRLAEDLKAAGAVVWIDQLDIDPGQRWDRAVEDALNRCPRMLVVLSPASVQNDNVRDEISFALRKQKTIIPVLYLDCDIPLRLERHQHIDFRTDHARGLKTLCRALGVEPVEPVPPSPPDKKPKQAAKLPRSQPAQAVRKGPARRERRTTPALDDQALTLRELRTLTGHTRSVTGVALSRDGRLAVSASWDRTLKVWEVNRGSELRTLAGHTGDVTGVALSGDGRLAVSASEDKTLKVWEVNSGSELRTPAGHTSYVTGVALSGDGRLAVSASRDRTLKVWDVNSGSELRTLAGHTDRVRGVALSGDGRLAVSASRDRTLKVWEVNGGSELRTLAGHTGGVDGVALGGDGRLAVSASNDLTLKVWDVNSGSQLATFKTDASLLCCVVCPDGKTILAGDYRGGIHVLRLE
jgi:hypothetical protein